ncbi:hypothetical protein SAMN04488100_1564 [Alkalibacterium putridalgicola]|uniref:Uncharacterized protein n=1 Tax=Alkalibacterium putridalgicola TaxID=426703 RepID=A0A1H7XMD1_9LACT|nr:hypothetical protein [Alkalibacterium putridalgicola]GEK90301.1 hypothetical protein APU01nite_23400 [Alkalibacterium putridalgicola]SEM34835.1 hypothetical protein SAMN04488100_1564 [Alkalibacterium putridalgicola]
MVNNNQRKTIGIALLIISIIGLGAWIIFENSRPQTSAELLDEIMIFEDLAGDLSFSEATDNEQTVDIISNYLPIEDSSHISQFFTLDSGDDTVLLVETTPGLVDEQLQIKHAREIDRDVYEDLMD